jgi:hypothetical protein
MTQKELNMNVALKDTTPITCEECGHSVFQEGVLLRKISRFVTIHTVHFATKIIIWSIINIRWSTAPAPSTPFSSYFARFSFIIRSLRQRRAAPLLILSKSS